MKVAVLLLATVLSLIVVTSASNLKLIDFDPHLYDNTTSVKAYTDPYPSYFHLLYAVQYIVIGKPNPNQPDLFDLLDSAPDDFNLVEMVQLATQQFYLYWTDNGYDEDGFEELFIQWVQVVNVLDKEGAKNVTLGMLKPFIELLRPGNIFRILRKISKSGDNLNQYIREEFLSKIKNPYCRNYVGLWFQDIQLGKKWALDMFDAIGKPPTGLTNGNINWAGSYKICRKVEVSLGNGNGFHGKYCRTTLGFPLEDLPDVGIPLTDAVGLNIGICVPNQCPKEDVEAITLQVLKLFTVHKVLNINKVHCDENEPYDSGFIGVTVFLAIICGICFFATVFDCVRRSMHTEPAGETKEDIESKIKITGSDVVQKTPQRKKKNHPFVDFLLNCSLYTNSERIFRTDNGGKFTCLNGLRALSMVWIIFAHTFKYMSDYDKLFFVSNLLELKEIEENPIAQLIFGGMYGVDTFFVMSAFLLTYSMMNKYQKSNGMTTFEWVYFYVHRYWRLVPPYAIIFLINVFIMRYVGNGPFWDTDDYPTKNEECKTYWWAYFLLINNFVPNGKGVGCMGFLWYVSNDYQLYAISPIFLVLLFRYPLAGVVLLIFTLISSVSILAFLTENVFASKNREILTTLQSIWEDVYIKPYCRAGPYIVGIFLGYLFFKHKKVTMNKLVVIMGWITSTVLALATVFGGFTNHEKGGRRMEVAEYGAYFSLTRVAFPLSIGWIIFACHHGYGGIINRFLSARAFIPLTRISYCAYLIHPVILQSYYYAQEALFHGSGMTLLYIVLGTVVFSFFVAYLFTMLFEMPFVAIEKLAMSGRKGDKKSSDE